ncbi:uncharacterized protein LOC128739970 [Sabethes cyaneus]|uniref:uncharacterized protein LOC128739970 n=1 Tax=Sabethes cyaneus TaxID=53552 RepID=UPI00237E9F01|nr:uncharacterized protein LOC128739970 [Sabethes cyaneus]
MSSPAETATTSSQGKSPDVRSTSTPDRALGSKAEALNKEPLLNPPSNMNKKASSVKSACSKTSRRNSQVSRGNSLKQVGQNCRSCSSVDNSRMVQCDDCDEWHHFSCVGVDSTIESKPWRCAKCNRKVKKRSSGKQTKALKGTVNMKATGVLRRGTSAEKVGHQEKDTCKVVKSSDAVSVASATSRRSCRERLELQLRRIEAEQTLLEEKKKLVKKQFSVLEELADLDEKEAEAELDGEKSVSKVKDWLNEKEDGTESEYSGDEEELLDSSDYSEEEEEEPPVKNSSTFQPSKRSTAREGHRSQRRMLTTSNQFNCSLNRNQIAARQVVAKDLPVFSGNPEDWPLFFSTYESTTRMCGYTEDENMIRLRSCLKGDAFAAVRSFLLHPSTVEKAVNALKLRFGQPRVVLQSIKDKVLAMPVLKADSLNKTIDFALAVQNFVATIEACGSKEYMRDISLLSELVGKLPAAMKLEWARYTRSLRRVNLVAFSEWLYGIAEDACLVSEPRKNQEVRSQETYKAPKGYVSTHTEHQSWRSDDSSGPGSSTQKMVSEPEKLPAGTCVSCKGDCVSLAKCKRFLDLSYDGKWATVRENRVCRKCLKQHKGGCASRDCGVNGCNFKHHSLLHKELHAESQIVNTNLPREAQSCNTHQAGSSAVLFRYIPVIVYGNGIVVHCYAFLDDGSSLTLMDQDLAEELNLTGERNPLCLRWTGGTHRSEKDSRKVALDISGLKGKRFHFEDVRTVSELQLPCQSLDVEQLQSEYRYLKGIPVQSYSGVRPRLLIGVQHAYATLVRKSREGKVGQPIAINTNLGWTIYGGAPQGQSVSMLHYVYHVNTCVNDTERLDDGLDRAVKEYFSIESLGVTYPNKEIRSRDDERAMQLLHDLTQFNGERYETGLLWRNVDTKLPNSKPMALKRFYSLQRRMEKDPDLARTLDEKLVDYLSKGYIRKLTAEELAESHERIWYLPVFPVFNPNKPGKVRLVWDAAATINGVSLNSALLTGPDLLTPLVSILYKFRESRFAVCGDIREMFHQVGMRGEDQHSQRFLWWDSEDRNNINTYVMQVMTFGACCSPASAQFAKNLNAERFSEKFPAATKAIVQCTYVDDMLCSGETEQEVIELAKSVRFIHSEGGFEIRNWTSNSPAVLAGISGESCIEKNLDLGSSMATEKVLGLWWCTATDCFTFKINWSRLGDDLLKGERCPTKREVLRIMMSIYDPVGLVAHYLMYLKVLLQEIWRSGVGWDENIDQKCFAKWQVWLRLLPEIENLKIPRCYRLCTSARNRTEVQLHTFVDAGENGIAAVVYLRFAEDGIVECSLVGAKTRVAPLKYLTIPRLELQAAVIGARLAQFIAKGLTVKIFRSFLWSDSRNVLSWIRADHRKYSQFVATRISELLDLTKVSDWNWVPSKWNVADEGTKWQSRPSLKSDSRWYKGPEFLYQCEEEWPALPEKIVEPEEELRANVHVHVVAEKLAIQMERFGHWRRLVRATAYIFRFIRNTRPKLFTQIEGGLTCEEIRDAEDFHIRAAQLDTFRDELLVLKRNDLKSALPKRSPLYKLNPFVDERGLLRMRGRTGLCEYLSQDTVNPVILPRDHQVTDLIVRNYHDKFHHRNHESVINEIRQRFCISRLRRVYAKIRFNCQHCKLRDARPRAPEMADLPRCRLTAFVRPFTHTGIDYFGPMEVAIGRRVEKRWGVLFTCLCIRAVHLEVASSLTTNSCIMAIRNFIARRGTPSSFYSDRGTNFIGSERELKQALQAIDQNRMAQEFVSSSTSWHFNPPAAPHMGGSWERLVQSVKRNLSEMKLPTRPTDEELRNALIEVEGILNARPLTHVPVEDEAAPALTPNHWLLGSSDGSKPWSLLNEDSIALRRGWHSSQKFANQFWTRWLREYLPEITRRSKWHEKVPPITKGDIVLIVDPNSPRNCWPKGRVIGTVNHNGQVRTVTIQTANGVYERPAVKVAVLDVRSKEELADSEAESANWGGVSMNHPLDQSTTNALQQ